MVHLIALAAAACASAPSAGPLGEGMGGKSRIVAVDSARPPAAVTVQLDEPANVAVLLVIPGHSATLLYPRDSITDTQRAAGAWTIPLEVPGLLVRRDSGSVRQREGAIRSQDAAMRRRRTGTGAAAGPGPVPETAEAYLLLLTSPQPLVYGRMIERTGGVSIPTVREEAFNAIAKAVRATIPEPRTIAGYYQRVELTRPR